MVKRIVITIEQVLHGYLNGHQLLNSSIELLPEEKRTLLFHSDLSGSNVEDGFKEYITGYPLDNRNLYAFSKTWYASEMKRPGCVWTQTLLISFADLGKIPELKLLTSLFKRPIANQYEYYSEKLELTEDLLFNNFYHEYGDIKEIKETLLPALYEFPFQPIVVPCNSSDVYEDVILSIWSDQWPRLRRNFMFCSGALGFKSIDNRSFDLQFVPFSKVNLMAKQNDDMIIVKGKSVNSKFHWNLLLELPKTKLRHFLWSFGSDISGERKNYISLLNIFLQLESPNSSIESISNIVSAEFPSFNEAKYLKSKIYGNDSILLPKLSEREIIDFLVSSSHLDFISIDSIDLNNRIRELISENKISLDDFVEVWNNAKPNRINSDVWKNFDLTIDEFINIVGKNDKLAIVILDYFSDIVYSERLWRTPISFQHRMFASLFVESDRKIDQYKLVTTLLEAESECIFDFYKWGGVNVISLSLDWLNAPSNPKSLISQWSKFIVKEKWYNFKEWILKTREPLSTKIFALIFSYAEADRIVSLKLSSKEWLAGYNALQKNNYHVRLVYASSMLLSLSLQDKLINSEEIVAGVFHDVYSYAADSKIEPAIWNIIPKEEGENDVDDLSFMGTLFQLLGIGLPKKRNEVERWDYCEILIRTMVNKFIKYEWSADRFLKALKNSGAFKRAVRYCMTFKKGRRFLAVVIQYYKSNKNRIFPFQEDTLKILSKEIE